MEPHLTEEQIILSDDLQDEIYAFIEEDDPQSGVARLKEVLDSTPEDDSWKHYRGFLYALLAECFFEMEGIGSSDALMYANKAHEHGWENATTHALFGNFDRALELDVEGAELFFGRAVELKLLDGDEEGAYNLLEKGRSLYPNGRLALMEAQFLTLSEKFEEAFKILSSELEEEDPIFQAELHLLRIEVLMRLKRLDEAKSFAIQATNILPNDPFAFVELAAVQLLLGKNSVALKAAQRSVELDSSLPDTYAIRAAARFANKEYDAGFQDLKQIEGRALELTHYILGAIGSSCDEKRIQLPLYHEFLERVTKEVREATKGKEVSENVGGSAVSDPDEGSANPFAGIMPNMPPGFNPAMILNQMFDSEGNVRPMFKPIIKMALKSAPSMLKTIPPETLAKQNIDPKVVEQANLDNLSDAEFDRMMRMFYETLKKAT